MTNKEIIDEMIPNGGGVMIIYMSGEEAKINEFLETKSEDFYNKGMDYIIKSHQIYQPKYEHLFNSTFAMILKHPSNYQQLRDLRNDTMYNRQLPEGIDINSVTILNENASESGGSGFFSGMF